MSFVSRPPRKSLSIDRALVVVASLLAGSLCTVAPLCALTSSALCGLLTRRLIGNRALWAAGTCLFVGWLRAQLSIQEFDTQRTRIRDRLEEPRRCAVSGQVTGTPTLRGDTLLWSARLTDLTCDGEQLSAHLDARLYGGPRELARGDSFEAIGDIGALRMFQNFSLPDPLPTAARRRAVVSGSVLTLSVVATGRGLGAWLDTARGHVRRRISATFQGTGARMARALVLGDNDFELSDQEAFQRSGLAHLLAVSGSHLVFAVVSVVRVTHALLRRLTFLSAHCDTGRIAAALGVVLAPLYADFAGGSGSAWRAALMLMVALGTTALGHRPLTSRIVALSVLIAWLNEPLVIFDFSFVLSLAATAGLCALTRLATAEPASAPFPALDKLHQAAAITLAASLPCLPLLLLISPGLSLSSVAGNLLAAPLGELIALPLCLGHALTSPWPALEQGMATVAGGALTLVLEISRACSNSGSLYVELPPPNRWHFAALLITTCGWLAQRERIGSISGAAWFGLGALSVSLVELATLHHLRPGSQGLLQITSLDVGQGDATWIELPDGRAVLVDGGGFVGSPVDPGRLVLLPTLRARRRQRLDIVVLSHPHPDHFGGLIELAKRVPIGEFWLTGQGLAQGAGPRYAQLIEQLRNLGTPIFNAHTLCKRQLAHPDPHLELLAPCPGFSADQSSNDNSLVLRVSHGKHVALLPGDAEAWAEAQLLKHARSRLKANYLKVGHHGSRTSSGARFLKSVAPQVAVISCGVRNRFGHPHTETLDAFAAADIHTLRMDHSGAVQWQSDGTAQHLMTFRAQRAATLALPLVLTSPFSRDADELRLRK